MDSPQLQGPLGAPPAGQTPAASDSTSSPVLSIFSRGTAARSASITSSTASSPARRDSLDGYGPPKTPLELVREEPLERDDECTAIHPRGPCLFDGCQPSGLRLSFDPSLDSPPRLGYDLEECELTSLYPCRPFSHKKQRSDDISLSGLASRFSPRLPSLSSKKWKSKSAADPKLSLVVTHSDPPGTRTSSVGSSHSQLVCPALSPMSKHDSPLPPSPAQTSFGEGMHDATPGSMHVSKLSVDEPDDQGQATTPLLPPLMTNLLATDAPVQSPLQSPTIAATAAFPTSATPIGTPQGYTLPTPPLSTKPSQVSMRQRSRAGTTNAPSSDMPPLQVLDERMDEWSQRLGHADFSISPEPYLPEMKDVESYHLFRADWDAARCNYGKHLARVGEHYGTTSKIYLLTEEKWSAIDAEWKRHNAAVARVVEPMILRLSDGETDGTGSVTSIALLERPPPRVIVPQIDVSSGKFPRMDDEDIIGPMAFVPNRSQLPIPQDCTIDSRGSRRRAVLKFMADILGRGAGTKT